MFNLKLDLAVDERRIRVRPPNIRIPIVAFPNHRSVVGDLKGDFLGRRYPGESFAEARPGGFEE